MSTMSMLLPKGEEPRGTERPAAPPREPAREVGWNQGLGLGASATPWGRFCRWGMPKPTGCRAPAGLQAPEKPVGRHMKAREEGMAIALLRGPPCCCTRGKGRDQC